MVHVACCRKHAAEAQHLVVSQPSLFKDKSVLEQESMLPLQI